MILPSTEKRLLDIWKDADLSRPEDPAEREGGGAGEADEAEAPAAPPAREAAGERQEANPTPRGTPKLGERRRQPAQAGNER